MSEIDFTKEARDLKHALADNAYPAADGTADIDNHAVPIIEATLRNIAERAIRGDQSPARSAQQSSHPQEKV
jgi:hypothetical protein